MRFGCLLGSTPLAILGASMVVDNYHCLLTPFVVQCSTLVIPSKVLGPEVHHQRIQWYCLEHESKHASKIFVMLPVASEILTRRIIVVGERGNGKEESHQDSQVKKADLFAKTKSSG
jgi:hypothetical protein